MAVVAAAAAATRCHHVGVEGVVVELCPLERKKSSSPWTSIED